MVTVTTLYPEVAFCMEISTFTIIKLTFYLEQSYFLSKKLFDNFENMYVSELDSK